MVITRNAYTANVPCCVYTCSQLINSRLAILTLYFTDQWTLELRFIKFNDNIKVIAINNPHLDFYNYGQEVS